MTTTRTQCEYYLVENCESDDDTGYPSFAWDTMENRETVYVMLGSYFDRNDLRLENPRSMKNSDGNIVTIHDVSIIDIRGITQESIDTIGYVHVWEE